MLIFGCGGSGQAEPTAMSVAFAEAGEGRLIRALTVEGGCRVATEARIVESVTAVSLTVLGSPPDGSDGCTAEVKLRCVEAELRDPLGERAVRLMPPADHSYRRDATQRLTHIRRALSCRRVPVRT
jgi:hypothetical protein